MSAIRQILEWFLPLATLLNTACPNFHGREGRIGSPKAVWCEGPQPSDQGRAGQKALKRFTLARRSCSSRSNSSSL